jgi:hypothetical protein
MGDDPGTWGMGEEGAIYTPLSSTKPVRITQALRGFEGSITGTLAANPATGQTIAQAEANMYDLKRRVGQVYRLVLSDMAIPVVIANVVIAPGPEQEILRHVSFDFWQVGDLPFDVVL